MLRGTVLSVIFSILATGCVSGMKFHNVALDNKLGAEDVQRYESEWREISAKGSAHHATLEYSNWWPLGLFIYHRDCSVMRSSGPGGALYHVRKGEGFGPLSLLYATSAHATYNAQGERINWMRMRTSLAGCLLMSHETDAKLIDGRNETSSSWHLVHHILNLHKMNGHTYVSLFTVPNAIGADLPASHVDDDNAEMPGHPNH
jgi:hypothetical protein